MCVMISLGNWSVLCMLCRVRGDLSVRYEHNNWYFGNMAS